jgi:hypothetical protein
MSIPRMVECSTGRACVTARWGISIGAADTAFMLAIWITSGRANPLSLMDALAESWRELDSEIALELPE